MFFLRWKAGILVIIFKNDIYCDKGGRKKKTLRSFFFLFVKSENKVKTFGEVFIDTLWNVVLMFLMSLCCL